MKTPLSHSLVIVLLGLVGALPCSAQQAPALANEAHLLTLEEALALARERSPALAVVRARVSEAEERDAAAFTHYLPRVRTQANYLLNNNEQGILIPQGSLGVFPELGGAFPPSDRNIPQGGTDLFFALTTVAQPLTHFFKIREGRGVAAADEDVALGVLRAYAGLLLAGRERELAQARALAAQERTTYREAAVEAGMALAVASREAQVQLLQARQTLLEKEGQVDDLAYALADALGLPPGSPVQVQDPGALEAGRVALEAQLAEALARSPDVLEARALVKKATHGVGAARAEYLPEVGLLGAHIYQSSVPFFPKHTLGVGVQAKWTILDFGQRGRVVDERRALLAQAEHNVRMVEGRVRGEVEAAHRKLERAAAMVELAREASALRAEGSRLEVLQVSSGYAVPADGLDAAADRLEGELDLLKAELGYRVALAELERATGTLGRGR